jgi:glyoxylase-like metal-dependent hydrolase (beta-lactamase superfamily II)
VTPGGASWIDDRTAYIDLQFAGVPRVIAAYVLDVGDGLALVDCGPTTTLPRLLEGIRALGRVPEDIRTILGTHVHLDHVGAAGILLGRFPDARVYIHEVGAPHLIDPTSLVRSASRIYGDDMDRLWGEIAPIQARCVVVVEDGMRVDAGDRRLDVIYTPGHASHHVAYYEAATGTVFAGDVAGVRIPPSHHPLPPTPPPDIDINAWHDSIQRLRDVDPRRLMLAHFGVADDVGAHLDALDRELDEWLALVARHAAEGHDRDAIVDLLLERVHGRIAREGTASIARQLELATPAGMSVDGLLRYLRKRQVPEKY